MTTKDKNISHSVPQHIAIIMDGNGRWAKARGLDRTEGHKQGAETVKTVVKEAARHGVKYLTLFAFSTENWKRPQYEVDAIMNLLVYMLGRETPELNSNNVKLLTIGDTSQLEEKARESLQKSIEITANNSGLTLVIALNYGSRAEILRAINNWSDDVSSGKIDQLPIDEKTFEKYLFTYNIPDPDLLIRTSGEQRISNFLLWQLAYSEFYFTSCTWPEFSKEEFSKAISTFASRERRFGMTGEQIEKNNDKPISSC